MKDESHQQAQEAREAAIRLSEADSSLPLEAEKAYMGPNPLGQSGLRAALFGVIGWFGGNWVGRVGSQVVEKGDARAISRRNFNARHLGGFAAFVGAVMGAYGGMKDTRYHQKQVDELQTALRGQHGKTEAMKEALKQQLDDNGRLKAYEREEKKPEAEPEAKEAEKPQETQAPDSKVQSEELALDETLSHAKGAQKDSPSV